MEHDHGHGPKEKKGEEKPAMKKAPAMHAGHAMHMPQAGGGAGHGAHGGHMAMIEDFKRRLIICLILTVPIIVLSPAIQEFFRYRLEFPGSIYVQFLLSSAVYFYGGYPFLRGSSAT